MDTKPDTVQLTEIKKELKELSDKEHKAELLESFEKFLARKAVQTS